LRKLERDGAHAAGGAGDKDGVAGLWSDGLECVVSGSTGQAKGTGGSDIQPLGDSGGEGGRRGDELAEASAAELGLHDHTENRIANVEGVDAMASGFDRAGEVLAEDDREAVFHALEDAVGDAADLARSITSTRPLKASSRSTSISGAVETSIPICRGVGILVRPCSSSSVAVWTGSVVEA
jgi:hypothetical protein